MKQILFALISGCLLLASPLKAGAVELTFWSTEIHEDRINTIKFLIRAFSVMQDGVSVKLASVDENELFRRVREAAADNATPHLIGADSQLLIALHREGFLDGGAASEVIRDMGADRFYKGALKQLCTPDHRSWYAIPFLGWVQGIWYRADWFEEAGLAPPTDWEAILAAAKHFYDPARGSYGILVGTAGDAYATQVFTQLARSNGAAMFDRDGRVVFDSPAMAETLKFYARLAQYGPDGPQTWRARDYFLQGRLAMLFYSTFIMDDLALPMVARDSLTGGNFEELTGASFDPDLVRHVEMVPIIRHRRDSGYGSIKGFGIASGLAPEELAAVRKFLAFLYDPPHYVAWLHMAPGGMLPVLRDVAASDRFMADPSGIFRRYGRSKIREIIAGLSSIDSFSLVDGRIFPASSVVYAENVIPEMIAETVFKGVPASAAVAHTARRIEAIVRSFPDAAGRAPRP
jgi:multiple sugar transport system substrate-binding protein